ncbi:hypothetical protein JX266_008364 [Neoarthrinium moseri]|nr:hypothetical protein JX266_008364 [Neoarthrinium moseri]
MASTLSAAPVLSTPAEHTFFEDPTVSSATPAADRPARSDDELHHTYEIARTAAEIAQRRWRRVALQFPDAMLGDAGWVVGALERELRALGLDLSSCADEKKEQAGELETDINAKTAPEPSRAEEAGKKEKSIPRIYVLADTSYSACCVDEIAAEHADADAVVHYGRACLSPPSRLPVFHVFTRQELDYDAVVEAFEKEFGDDKEQKVVVMADVMFQEHVSPFCDRLKERGWNMAKATEIVRDPSATIPNRRLIDPNTASDCSPEQPPPDDADDKTDLQDYHLFHISSPPMALLLTLSSRLASLRIYPTPASPYTTATTSPPDPSRTPGLLRRRYGLVMRLATASIIGILVNTLSVQNYLSTIDRLRDAIAAAGKKSYTIVVGKLNAAKLANFSEIDGWVVVGCWESGLVEQEDMWKPVITPFELEMALVGDDKRIWDGRWWGGIEGVGGDDKKKGEEEVEEPTIDKSHEEVREEVEGGVSDEESEPPEFDFRTGKLVSNSRPMRMAIRKNPAAANGPTGESSTSPGSASSKQPSAALVQRKAGEIAMVNGVVSPGAQYLISQRTWQGLGSDFNNVDDEEKEYEESTVVEEGRSGVARGYTVGQDDGRT